MIRYILAAMLLASPAWSQTGTLSGGSVKSTGSTTSRTLADRFAEAKNIKDFGAVCDGSTDDRAAIAAAVSAASSTSKSVFFPPSATACMMGSSITVPSGVTVAAIPGTATIKAKPGNTSSPLLLSFESDTTLIGLTVDGGGTAFGSANNVMSAFGGGTPIDNVKITQNKFANTRGVAFLASTSVTRVLIEGNVFEDVGEYWRTSNAAADRKQAIVFCCGTAANSYGHIIRGNRFERIGLDAISADDLVDITVVGNVFNLDQTDQLTWVWSGGDPTAFSAAVYCTETVARCTVTGNVVDQSSGNAIDSVALETVITANTISASGQAGINCASYSGETDTICLIVGNNIRSSGAWTGNLHLGGITVGNSPDNNAAYKRVTIVANSVTDASDYGIYSFPGSTFTNKWIDASNNVGGTTAAYLASGVIPGPDADSVSGSIVATTGNIARIRNLTTLDVVIVGAGGSAGTALACGVDVSCSGPGGGGGGGVYPVYGISWESLGTRTCAVSAPAGVAPAGAVAASTTVTCGSIVYQARAGGAGQSAAIGAATGGGGGGSPIAAGGSGSGGTGGSGGGPGAANGGSGTAGSGNGNLLLGSGGGGSAATGAAGAGGNSYGTSGGGAGGGCNAGEPVAGSTGGATVLGQAGAGANGTSHSDTGYLGGMGGGGGASSKTAGANGGNGATPGGGAGGAGNGCDGVGTAGTSGTSGGGAVYYRQM